MNETVGKDKMNVFMGKIKKFNEMYGLPSNDIPTNLGQDKLKSMHHIISEEVLEFRDILAKMKEGCCDEEVLGDVSDLLCDLIVYCCTFARQWGIDVPKTLDIIMESNFSKLGEDGKPIHDARGKVMKGPNYWKPEPQIRQLIRDDSTGIINDFSQWLVVNHDKVRGDGMYQECSDEELSILKKYKNFMTDPVCTFKGEVITAVSRLGTIEGIERFLDSCDFIPYTFFRNEEGYLLRGHIINEEG